MVRNSQTSYLQDETLDRLARQNLELLSELWIMRDRLASLELLLERKGIATRSELENMELSDEDEAYLERLRAEMIEKVVHNRPNEMGVEELKERGNKSAERMLRN